MKNSELFAKDPLSWSILNEGVTSNNTTDPATLKYELSTFVCEGEYLDGLSRILDGFLGNLGSDQKAVWVSGFYGSGKSHLVKVLRYLWNDEAFADGTTPRSLAHLPEEIKIKLLELSNKAKQLKVPLISAGGTLRSGIGTVPQRLLSIVFNSMGMPEDISAAKLWLDLRKDGKLEQVKQIITDAGLEPLREFERIYSSEVFLNAYVATHPEAGNAQAVSTMLMAQYKPNVTEITTKDMVNVLKRTLSEDTTKIPLTVIVLDEVQQFINNNADIANEVQEAVEACSKSMNGRVMFVSTGQSALNETPNLQKLMGRFTIKVPLKDTDVQTVIRRIVLQKKDEQKASLGQELEDRSGEITRQLKSTRLATKTDDSSAYIADYPLLPVRRRFWERVLQHVDATGSTAQMRTQLRVIHEACRAIATAPVGTVITGDFLYDQLSADLIQTGGIQKRFSEIIEEQKKKDPDGSLRSRICALVYLINKLPRETDADDGVRANVDHLADLMCDNLKTGVTELRQKLPALLDSLVAEGVLMFVDQEYRLQTTEGANWENEYRQRRQMTLTNEPLLASSRTALLQERINTEINNVHVTHGSGKVDRQVSLHIGSSAPAASNGLVVWVRDGYSESETSVIKDIQAKSSDDPTIHVFIAKATDMRTAIAENIATRDTLNFKGMPSTPEGQEARRSMETRSKVAEAVVVRMAREIIEGARVYLSGGTEVVGEKPKDAVSQAAKKVVDRLYPKFHEADHANWHTVTNRAKEGNGSPLEVIGFKGDTDKHPVAVEILKCIGSDMKGSELIKTLGAPPFGWSKEAVVGTIAALCVTGHLKATLSGRLLSHAELDNNKVPQATLRKEHPVLTALQLLKVKGLFTKANMTVPPGQENAQAPALVAKLKELAAAAGAEAPAPVAPQPPMLKELSGVSGNDLLFKLFENHETLSGQIEQWIKTAAKLKPRLKDYEEARFLLNHASQLPEATEAQSKLDAIVAARSLLDDPDPVATIKQDLTKLLHQALKVLHEHYAATFEKHRQQNENHADWKNVPAANQQEYLKSAGIVSPAAQDTTASLRDTLSVANLDTRATKIAALQSQFQAALNKVIDAAQPQAQYVTIQAATLKTESDVDAWLETTKKALLDALSRGTVIVR